MNIGDKVIKDLGEAYLGKRDRVAELENRIAELEEDRDRLRNLLYLVHVRDLTQCQKDEINREVELSPFWLELRDYK